MSAVINLPNDKCNDSTVITILPANLPANLLLYSNLTRNL